MKPGCDDKILSREEDAASEKQTTVIYPKRGERTGQHRRAPPPYAGATP